MQLCNVSLYSSGDGRSLGEYVDVEFRGYEDGVLCFIDRKQGEIYTVKCDFIVTRKVEILDID